MKATELWVCWKHRRETAWNSSDESAERRYKRRWNICYNIYQFLSTNLQHVDLKQISECLPLQYIWFAMCIRRSTANIFQRILLITTINAVTTIITHKGFLLLAQECKKIIFTKYNSKMNDQWQQQQCRSNLTRMSPRYISYIDCAEQKKQQQQATGSK